MNRQRLIFALVVGVFVAVTAATRVPAPWRFGLVNDEMLHLQSWRNHYGTDDIFPLFLEKLEDSGVLTPERFDQVARLYASSTLFQRGLLVLVDGHPPGYPSLAEFIQVVSDSSLTAARLPSMIASCLTIWFLYLLGVRLRGPPLGFWLAALGVGNLIAVVYAGLARSYALGHCAFALALLTFVQEQLVPRRSPWRFLLAALAAQSLNWMAWPVLGPLVAVEFIRRMGGGRAMLRLAAQTWWYVLPSVALVAYMHVQTKNPSLNQHIEVTPLSYIIFHAGAGSVFSVFDGLVWSDMSPYAPSFSFDRIYPSVLILLALTAVGMVIVAADISRVTDVPDEAGLRRPMVVLGLFIVLLPSFMTPLLMASFQRFMLFFLAVPAVFSAVALDWMFRRGTGSQLAAAGYALLVTGILFVRGEHIGERILVQEVDYAGVADQVRETMRPGDVWAGYHYPLSNCLYRYGPLPEPILLLTLEDLFGLLESMPDRDHGLVLFTSREVYESIPMLRGASGRWDVGRTHHVVRLPGGAEPDRE